jgi:imidazoleglycerol phosphate synthase glutamine amidotransferase subunit HisH
MALYNEVQSYICVVTAGVIKTFTTPNLFTRIPHLLWNHTNMKRGHAVVELVEALAISREIAGSIPDGVIESIH